MNCLRWALLVLWLWLGKSASASLPKPQQPAFLRVMSLNVNFLMNSDMSFPVATQILEEVEYASADVLMLQNFPGEHYFEEYADLKDGFLTRSSFIVRLQGLGYTFWVCSNHPQSDNCIFSKIAIRPVPTFDRFIDLRVVHYGSPLMPGSRTNYVVVEIECPVRLRIVSANADSRQSVEDLAARLASFQSFKALPMVVGAQFDRPVGDWVGSVLPGYQPFFVESRLEAVFTRNLPASMVHRGPSLVCGKIPIKVAFTFKPIDASASTSRSCETLPSIQYESPKASPLCSLPPRSEAMLDLEVIPQDSGSPAIGRTQSLSPSPKPKESKLKSLLSKKPGRAQSSLSISLPSMPSISQILIPRSSPASRAHKHTSLSPQKKRRSNKQTQSPQKSEKEKSSPGQAPTQLPLNQRHSEGRSGPRKRSITAPIKQKSSNEFSGILVSKPPSLPVMASHRAPKSPVQLPIAPQSLRVMSSNLEWGVDSISNASTFSEIINFIKASAADVLLLQQFPSATCARRHGATNYLDIKAIRQLGYSYASFSHDGDVVIMSKEQVYSIPSQAEDNLIVKISGIGGVCTEIRRTGEDGKILPVRLVSAVVKSVDDLQRIITIVDHALASHSFPLFLGISATFDLNLLLQTVPFLSSYKNVAPISHAFDYVFVQHSMNPPTSVELGNPLIQSRPVIIGYKDVFSVLPQIRQTQAHPVTPSESASSSSPSPSHILKVMSFDLHYLKKQATGETLICYKIHDLIKNPHTLYESVSAISKANPDVILFQRFPSARLCKSMTDAESSIDRDAFISKLTRMGYTHSRFIDEPVAAILGDTCIFSKLPLENAEVWDVDENVVNSSGIGLPQYGQSVILATIWREASGYRVPITLASIQAVEHTFYNLEALNNVLGTDLFPFIIGGTHSAHAGWTGFHPVAPPNHPLKHLTGSILVKNCAPIAKIDLGCSQCEPLPLIITLDFSLCT